MEHDDINILCLGEKVVSTQLAKEILNAFLRAEFSGEERHKRRLEKVLKIESENFIGRNKNE